MLRQKVYQVDNLAVHLGPFQPTLQMIVEGHSFIFVYE